ncbi:hypothetical protein Dsin_023663 [Dipteronia sinensis]|uniref:LRAT domain-containing protein n=1 Tax=Dipteronia sinensis TaxID=43782 RepID=A0AAE0A3Q7_9ROSI|nr:hypothetical protein Dsin_023663 [Dipteronia sinensis]
MGLLSNKIDRQELKPGDHIYCWRKAFIYAHHGIYVGASLVIHFTQGPAGKEKGRVLISSSLPDPKISDVPCPRCGDHNSSFNNGVILSCIDCFLSGGKLNLFEYGVSRAYFLADVRGGTCTLATSDPPRDVLHRANILLEKGFGDYDVFKNNREDFAIYCRTGLLVISSSTRVGQSGQVAALGATSSWIFSSLANKFKGVTAVGSGVCATAVGSGVYYCYSRLNSDIGVRSDVAKVAVERLVPPAPVKRLVPIAPPAPAPAPAPAPVSYEPEDHASSTSTREMKTPPVTPTPAIVDHQSSSVLAQQLAILKQPIGVKLNDNNFVLWKQEVTAAIQGLGLQGFLDGKSICPPETTMNSDGNLVTNPAHDFWNRQDQLIVSRFLWKLRCIQSRRRCRRPCRSSSPPAVFLRVVVVTASGRVLEHRRHHHRSSSSSSSSPSSPPPTRFLIVVVITPRRHHSSSSSPSLVVVVVVIIEAATNRV